MNKFTNKVRKIYAQNGDINDLGMSYIDIKKELKIIGYVSDKDFEEVVKLLILNRDYGIVKYINSCENTFYLKRYKIYKKYIKKYKVYSASLLALRLKFGSTLYKQKYEEIKNKKTLSLKNMIKKYGKTLGIKKWNEFCERNKGNYTLERAISLYGEKIGKSKYENSQYKLKNKNTKQYYVDTFGEELGLQKYYSKNKKNSISSKLFAKNAPAGFYDNLSLSVLTKKYGIIDGRKKYDEIQSRIQKNHNISYNFIISCNVHKIMSPNYIYHFKKPLQVQKKFNFEQNIAWVYQDNASVTPFGKYRYLVDKYTNLLNLKKLKDIDKRGPKNYHLDHIISAYMGFKNDIPARNIASLDNLQMISYKENTSKRKNSYSVISQCEHIKEVYYSKLNKNSI